MIGQNVCLFKIVFIMDIPSTNTYVNNKENPIV